MQLTISWWAENDWYFIPTINLHREHKYINCFFLKFTLELAYYKI